MFSFKNYKKLKFYLLFMKIETKIKEYIEEAEILTFNILKDFNLTSEKSLRVILSNMVKKGTILSPKKGVYVSKNFDPFKIATMLEPGYISLTAALYYYHFISEYPFTIYIASEKIRNYKLGNYELVYFKAINFKYVDVENKVAFPEKAIYDSLKYYKIVPFKKTLEAIYHARNINWNNFIDLISKEKSSFFQRLGYLLSIMPKKNKKIEKIIDFCKERINKKSKIYLYGRIKGVFIKEWNIIDNLGEKELLSWWK
ncbi:MAG: hypothetical protein DRP10_00055 [Candidatus Aenigmatarchaeota archaeon]|nr:MAG: hypothetical protein DRP10_00055 [Candidatus Aenigmarchaeota archaeon]